VRYRIVKSRQGAIAVGCWRDLRADGHTRLGSNDWPTASPPLLIATAPPTPPGSRRAARTRQHLAFDGPHGWLRGLSARPLCFCEGIADSQASTPAQNGRRPFSDGYIGGLNARTNNVRRPHPLDRNVDVRWICLHPDGRFKARRCALSVTGFGPCHEDLEKVARQSSGDPGDFEVLGSNKCAWAVFS